ncbi:hypothetical protein CL617_02785 [archaeon]|nr:hypothetical protein [archaeon]|tara:strand:- start:17608 stop:18009 length:402 start_codon:yes stop_codon:yes gene_type:complete
MSFFHKDGIDNLFQVIDKELKNFEGNPNTITIASLATPVKSLIGTGAGRLSKDETDFRTFVDSFQEFISSLKAFNETLKKFDERPRSGIEEEWQKWYKPFVKEIREGFDSIKETGNVYKNSLAILKRDIKKTL